MVKAKIIFKNLIRLLWPKSKLIKSLMLIAYLALSIVLFMNFLYNPIFEAYTGVTNAELTYDNGGALSQAEFEALSKKLTYDLRVKSADERLSRDGETEYSTEVKKEILMKTRSMMRKTNYDHIKYFRKAGILEYKGPETCLQCHETMKIKHGNEYKEVSTMEDVLSSIHFQFQSTASGFSTYGYDGRKVNEGLQRIPVGKIDRACGIPGSFSWTGWAALVETNPNKSGAIELRSEGCGQCHIGGNYHPATERMMPIGDVPKDVEQGIDCLICHSDQYDMNKKYVIKDKNGNRWNQDRSMKAALTVGMPSNDNCLNCHQHNMGGDLYQGNVSAKSLGDKNKRILHPGAKRGNPFDHDKDVHYRAGLVCTDCHVPQGHKIPRGKLGTDLVGNDLPDVKVACENCHTSAPHTSNPFTRVILNGHINRIACETCHVTHLEDLNVVLRDWIYPEWDDEEGIYTPTDIYRSGKASKGFTYLWFNGNGTFLANALGANPNRNPEYNPLMKQLVRIDDLEIIAEIKMAAEKLKLHYPEINVEEYVNKVTNTLSQLPPNLLEKRKKMIEKHIRPLMNQGDSKIYPFKLFNAQMYEDLSNHGPYGAMILPFDYNKYYQTGNPKEAVKKAIQNPIVKRMYEMPFKYYMMDEFMRYFGVDEWSTTYPLKDGKLVNVEPKWMRQMGTLMINHGITKDAWQCADCHQEKGIMDFRKLGYKEARAKELENMPEVKQLSSKLIKN